MENLTQTIQWAPFSQKHIDYITRALMCFMSVAEGSVRAGKTIDNCIIAQMFLDVCPDKIHLASGSSQPNAKLNIGDCNGYGLEYQFRGRCHWGKYKENEALFITDCFNREKIVIFAGGGKADSYKKILGNSYGLWIATEINEHYDCDDSKTSFIKVAMARQIAAKRRMILWDLNPSHPDHRIYTEYIDKYANEGLLGGYNYGHFTINDNLSISDRRKEEIISQYNKNSIWYKRDILGKRVVSQGLVYENYATDPSKRRVNDEFFKENPIILIEVGIDYGGNKSGHSFVATAFTQGWKYVVALKSKRIMKKPGQIINANVLGRELVMFITTLAQMYPDYLRRYNRAFEVNCDSAESVLIDTFRTVATQNHLPANILPARKNPIIERIKALDSIDGQDRLRVHENAQTVNDAIMSAVWDKKAGHEDERLDNGTSDIDTMDAFEYSWEKHIRQLLS